MYDLFTDNMKQFAPLADRMRPSSLSEFIGQEHLIYKNSFLVRAITSGSIGSCIFYGPPATGKTTIANIIANTCKGQFRKLNAVSSGVGDAKQIIEEARNALKLYGTRTFLLLDECHRWNKAQSDCVLQAVEEGSITFIGSTTENPYINMTRAIVSRCRVFEFKPLSKQNIITALNRALTDKERGYGELKIDMQPDALEHLAWACSGDVRNAYNALELAVKTTPANADGVIVIDKQTAEECIQKKAISLDENTFYDVLSAFCKSLRGSDADAALYYSQKLLLSGCDPKIIARRMIAHASEDVGMADSNALLIAISALEAVKELGMPECELALSHAIIYICEAEKSNSVYLAMSAAKEDAKNFIDAPVPNNLKNHPAGYNDKTGKYKYPHDYGGYVKQTYLPAELKDRVYYKPLSNGKEKNMIRKKERNK
ncbi:MAG: replication-associated recombination protein A [Clostridia bacterium]|nr:replication-associated recombination protein A [Clostridia bacterium]